MKKPSEVHGIIYQTLESFLTANELTKAISIWEERYSQLSQLRLNAFINDIKALGCVNENRQHIYRHITKQLLGNETPSRTFVDQANTQAPTQGLSELFVIFAKRMLEELRSDQQTTAISHVQTLLHSKKMRASDISNLINGLRTNSKVDVEVPAKVLRQSINQIYIVLCELVGPVQADTILNHAVAETAKISERIKLLI